MNSSPARACVMGFPIGHSLSPKLHGYWLKQYGIDGDYGALSIDPAHLKDALKMLVDRGYRGCNLTLPLKEAALSLMDDHDESCLMSGAVNTVVINNGRLKGFNSDGFGFVESLKAQHANWNGERVTVLGTGGAARGIIASLRGAGVRKFVLVNRTRAKAEKIVKAFNLDADVYDWDQRHAALSGATLFVNASSLGMAAQPALDIDLAALPLTSAVCDIVYRPLDTPLLAQARKRGHPVAEGLPMLLHQGRLGFDYWFNKDPDVTQDLYNFMAQEAA